MYRRRVWALFEVKTAMVPSTMASVRMRRRTKRLTTRRRPQPLSLLAPAPHCHPRMHLIQKRENQSSSNPSFRFEGRRPQSPSLMKTRPASLPPRLPLTVCSHRDGQFLRGLPAVAPPRAVARDSGVAAARLAPTASVQTWMCLASS